MTSRLCTCSVQSSGTVLMTPSWSIWPWMPSSMVRRDKRDRGGERTIFISSFFYFR